MEDRWNWRRCHPDGHIGTNRAPREPPPNDRAPAVGRIGPQQPGGWIAKGGADGTGNGSTGEKLVKSSCRPCSRQPRPSRDEVRRLHLIRDGEDGYLRIFVSDRDSRRAPWNVNVRVERPLRQGFGLRVLGRGRQRGSDPAGNRAEGRGWHSVGAGALAVVTRRGAGMWRPKGGMNCVDGRGNRVIFADGGSGLEIHRRILRQGKRWLMKLVNHGQCHH